MKKIFFLVLFIAACTVLVLYFTRAKPVAVSLVSVERGTIESTAVNTRAGTVKASRRAFLAPAIGGQIDRLRVKEGMRVKAGDLLLELWNKDLRADAALAESQVKAAEANSDAACVEAANGERQAERYAALLKRKVVPEEEADKVISTGKELQAKCRAARSEVEVRRGESAAAAARLQRTLLLAPFDGVVAEVNGELGEYVTPSPPGIPTPPAVDLVDDSSYYVSAPIDEVDAAAIRVGMEARITMDAFAGRTFSGKVRRIASYVLDREKQARTVDIEVAFADPADYADLLPGYSADAEVVLQVKKDILRIPAEAMTADKKVFVFDGKTGRLSERSVTTGLSDWQHVEITSGLAEKDRIVLYPDRKGVQDGALAVEEKKGKE